MRKKAIVLGSVDLSYRDDIPDSYTSPPLIDNFRSVVARSFWREHSDDLLLSVVYKQCVENRQI